MLKLYSKAQSFIWKLRDDAEGATIIEYSLLVGLLTVAVVATVVIMGTWISGQWTGLQAATGAI